MEDTCKLCGRGLMAYWCQNPVCSSFVDAVNAKSVPSEGFYLNRQGVFRTSSDAWLCKECGRGLAFKALTNPCPECLSNPERMELEAIKDELEISPESLYRRTFEMHEFKLDKEWNGYVLEVLGSKLGRFSQLQISEKDLELASKVMPYSIDVLRSTPRLLLPFTCLNVPEDPDLIVKIHRLKVRHENSAVFAQMRFPPYGHPVTTIKSEGSFNERDFAKAQKALEFLGAAVVQTMRQGRPSDLEGETFESIATTYSWLWCASQHAESDRKLKAPTLMDLAYWYRVHRTTLYKHITARLKVSWRAIKDEGVRRGRLLSPDQVPPFIRGHF